MFLHFLTWTANPVQHYLSATNTTSVHVTLLIVPVTFFIEFVCLFVFFFCSLFAFEQIRQDNDEWKFQNIPNIQAYEMYINVEEMAVSTNPSDLFTYMQLFFINIRQATMSPIPIRVIYQIRGQANVLRMLFPLCWLCNWIYTKLNGIMRAQHKVLLKNVP